MQSHEIIYILKKKAALYGTGQVSGKGLCKLCLAIPSEQTYQKGRITAFKCNDDKELLY